MDNVSTPSSQSRLAPSKWNTLRHIFKWHGALKRCVSATLIALLVFLAAACSRPTDPPIPLSSGRYVFQHRFAEHPTLASIRVDVELDGSRIVITNPVASDPFPAGTLAEGRLMWHPGSGQWIIGSNDSDRSLRDVGGCSDGPEVVDLAAKTYWTC